MLGRLTYFSVEGVNISYFNNINLKEFEAKMKILSISEGFRVHVTLKPGGG